MAKIIAAINITIDGFIDHTAGIPDEAIHDHYTDLLNSGDVILYGRTTFELMKYWQTLLEKPSGEKAMDDFARAIDRIPKIVFSNTLDKTGWERSATLAKKPLEDTVLELKKNTSGEIFVGSPSLISQLTDLRFIDEYQLCVHPVIIGKGMLLFEGLDQPVRMKLLKSKNFDSGAVIQYYQPEK